MEKYVYTQGMLEVEILLDAEASPDEVAAVAEIAREAGLQGPVRANIERKSGDDLSWLILLIVALRPFVEAFFGEAAKDSYRKLPQLVSKWYAARRGEHGSVSVEDNETSSSIIFSPDLPKEAYREFARMGERLEGHSWKWDEEGNSWKGVNMKTGQEVDSKNME